MAETDWAKIGIETGLSLVSGIGGLLVGVWRWGRSDLQRDQAIKDDYEEKIDALREEMRQVMAATEKAAALRNETLVDQFQESFNGLRRQLDEQKLVTERNFVRRDDFREFRAEISENFKEVKAMIAGIGRR
jgi:hypothetical protein